MPTMKPRGDGDDNNGGRNHAINGAMTRCIRWGVIYLAWHGGLIFETFHLKEVYHLEKDYRTLST